MLAAGQKERADQAARLESELRDARAALAKSEQQVANHMRRATPCNKLHPMFKKKPSAAKPAEQRLHKVAVKRVRLAKVERARFLAEVRATHPTEAGARKAGQLVGRVRAAKAAPFLQQYRIAA